MPLPLLSSENLKFLRKNIIFVTLIISNQIIYGKYIRF